MADRSTGRWNGVEHVDVDAARSIAEQVIGLGGLLEQAWHRYARPIAVTECHNGSTRDEQARWFIEAWETVERLRGRGVDVRALTAWSLLGSYDWNRMVTSTAGHYEPGVFDMRGGQPQPTLMAQVLRDLADGRSPAHPGLAVRGWWHADRRETVQSYAVRPGPGIEPPPPTLAIIEGDPALTATVLARCQARGLHNIVLPAQETHRLAAMRPWAVFDARLAAQTPEPLPGCGEAGVTQAAVRVVPSFDQEARPSPGPLLLAETAPLFDVQGWEAQLLDALDRGEQVTVEGRLEWRAVYLPSLVDGILDLLLDGVRGRVAFAPEPGWSHGEVARALAVVAGHEPCRVQVPDGGVPVPGDTPALSYCPTLECVLERFVADRRARAEHADHAYLEAAE